MINYNIKYEYKYSFIPLQFITRVNGNLTKTVGSSPDLSSTLVQVPDDIIIHQWIKRPSHLV